MKKLLRQHAVAFSFVLASFVVVAALYGAMPERVPTHWNLRGEADGFMSKPWGPFFLPLVAAALTGFLTALPALAPKEAPLERFARAFRFIVAAEAGFLLLLTLLGSLAAIGVQLDMTNAVCAAAGVLFAVLGNFLGKVTRNYFVGIRTPWTLANEEVWLRTHRLGGKLFVGAGLLAIVGALVGHGFAAMMTGVATAALVSTIYSYLLYRRISA